MRYIYCMLYGPMLDKGGIEVQLSTNGGHAQK
jgi:hypothetical protein